MRHVVFRLEKDRYALPLDSVREVVIAPERYSLVPHAGPAVCGVTTLRGRVVPVVDLTKLLSLDATSAGAKVVLLELSRRELGLLVTEVEGIEAIDKVSPAPRPSRAVKGVARVGPLTVTVLDVEGLDEAVTHSFASGPSVR